MAISIRCAICEGRADAVDELPTVCKRCALTHEPCVECDGKGVIHGRLRMGPGYSKPTKSTCKTCEGRGYLPTNADAQAA